MRRITIFAVAGAVALGACSSEADPPATDAADTTTAVEAAAEPGASVAGEPDEVDDVTIGGQRVNELGWMTATLTLANNSSEPSTYLIEYRFLDGAGNELYRGANATDNVQPGGTTTLAADSATEPPADGQWTVELVSVDRMAS